MYKLDITYSWDDAEEGMQFTSFQKAWEKAKELAMKEVETISIEHGAESGLFIDGDRVQTTLPGISHIRYQKTVRNTCHSILSCQIRRSLLSENMLCAMHFIRTSAHIIKIWKISFLTGAVLDIPEQKQEN